MNYAIALISGKQVPVSVGLTIDVAKIEGEKGAKVVFDKVLLFKDGETTQIGQPYIADFQIEGEIVDQYKGEKIDVKKYKQKVRYRRKMGFRPLLTKIKITKVGSKTVKKAVKTTKAKTSK